MDFMNLKNLQKGLSEYLNLFKLWEVLHEIND